MYVCLPIVCLEKLNVVALLVQQLWHAIFKAHRLKSKQLARCLYLYRYIHTYIRVFGFWRLHQQQATFVNKRIVKAAAYKKASRNILTQQQASKPITQPTF